MWTTLQGRGDVGTQMASIDTDLAALDGRNTMSDQITRAAKFHLQTISGATNLQKELGTNGYIMERLFGSQRPLVREFIEELIPLIDDNFEAFEQQVSLPTACTTFSYNVSRVEARYYNSCITASSNDAVDNPCSVTPVSFQLLIDEFLWGRYKGQQLPASLQLLLLPSAGLAPARSTNPVNLVPESPGNERNGGSSGPLGRE